MPELYEDNSSEFEELHNELALEGKLPPSDGITVPAAYKSADQNDPVGVMTTMFNQSLAYHGPAGLGEKGKYNEDRFNFITTEEGYNGSVHMVNGIKHVGYGTNLEANPDIIKDVLNFSPEKIQKLMAGDISLNQAQSRRLFDYKVQESERIVQKKLEGVPLNAHQRISLVSMAYNSPSLIGPNLVSHLKNSDMASVSYEILNKSNGNKLKALDARRKREHDKFFGNSQEMANIFKGDDFRKDESFQFASLLGISSAQAGDITPFAKVQINDQAPESIADNIVDKLTSIAEMFSFDTVEPELEDIKPAPTLRPDNFDEIVSDSKESQDFYSKFSKGEFKDIKGKDEKQVQEFFKIPGIDEPMSEADKFMWRISPKHMIPAPVRAVMIWATEALIKKAGSLVVDDATMKTWSPGGKQIYGAQFFTEGGQDVLKQMAKFCESKGQKFCTYQDWDEYFGEMDVNGMFASEMVNYNKGLYNLPKILKKKGMELKRPPASVLHAGAYGNSFLTSLTKMTSDFYDPRLEALMTIGQFTFTKDDNGNLIVGNDNKEMDEYNFKKNLSKTRESSDGFFYSWFRQLFADENSVAKFGFRVNLGRD